ncbi:hypothetical protein AB0D13_41230 [Streptomyces sp. NPDC048430]
MTAAAKLHEAITEYATAINDSRVDVGMAVKKAVRHPEAADS